jgi:hypothetical protein
MIAEKEEGRCETTVKKKILQIPHGKYSIISPGNYKNAG